MEKPPVIQVQQVLKVESFGRASITYVPLINGQPYPYLSCEITDEPSGVVALTLKTPIWGFAGLVFDYTFASHY